MSDFTTWRSLVDGEEIDVIPDRSVCRVDDNGSTTEETRKRGVSFETSDEWLDFDIQISSETSGVTRAYIHDTSDGSLVADKDISGKSGGDVVSFESVNLEAESEYAAVLDAEGSDYTEGFENEGEWQPPLASDDGELVLTGRIMDSDDLDNPDTSTDVSVHNVVCVGNLS